VLITDIFTSACIFLAHFYAVPDYTKMRFKLAGGGLVVDLRADDEAKTLIVKTTNLPGPKFYGAKYDGNKYNDSEDKAMQLVYVASVLCSKKLRTEVVLKCEAKGDNGSTHAVRKDGFRCFGTGRVILNGLTHAAMCYCQVCLQRTQTTPTPTSNSPAGRPHIRHGVTAGHAHGHVQGHEHRHAVGPQRRGLAPPVASRQREVVPVATASPARLGAGRGDAPAGRAPALALT
jgi:hypothetical protein